MKKQQEGKQRYRGNDVEDDESRRESEIESGRKNENESSRSSTKSVNADGADDNDSKVFCENDDVKNDARSISKKNKKNSVRPFWRI